MRMVKTLHEEAMDLAELADVAKLRGAAEKCSELLTQALEKAVVAADKIASNLDAEPTRSIIHRSAASLAIELGNFNEAERLLAVALAGEPPAEIAEELRDLFVQINLSSYFERRGLLLDMEQWKISKAS